MSNPVVKIEPLSPLGRKLVAEGFGTFVLVYTIVMVSDLSNAHNVGALAIGCTLMFLVFSLGHISGGMFNPAVSLAVWLSGNLETFELVGYVITQLFCGFFAALLCWYVGHVPGENYPCPEPTGNSSRDIGRLFIVEFIGTTALANSVLNCGVGQQGNSFFGLAIGFAVLGGAAAGGRISGGSYNPAVTTSLQTVHAIASSDAAPMRWWPVYIIAELLGGVAAFVITSLMGLWVSRLDDLCAIPAVHHHEDGAPRASGSGPTDRSALLDNSNAVNNFSYTADGPHVSNQSMSTKK